MRFATLLCLTAASLCQAADFPEADISNGVVKAKLMLPDTEKGYYRATRFDWSGQVASLQYKGHEYFGQWFERYDPKLHDAILGPVEEFLTDGEGLGYAAAKPGETFVKIGVGSLRKPEEPRFQQFKTYEIVDPGKWTVNRKSDAVEFIHELKDPSGYAYSYTKTLRLTSGRPELVIEHTLRNTGRKAIETDAYEHNFYVIDGKPNNPDVVVKFPFEVHADRDLKGLAETRGRELVYLKELKKGESTYTLLTGYGKDAKDYDIRVESKAAGAGVRQVGSEPIAKLVYWSIRTTPCPEAYVHMNIEPGQEKQWRIAYEFYTLP